MVPFLRKLPTSFLLFVMNACFCLTSYEKFQSDVISDEASESADVLEI